MVQLLGYINDDENRTYYVSQGRTIESAEKNFDKFRADYEKEIGHTVFSRIILGDVSLIVKQLSENRDIANNINWIKHNRSGVFAIPKVFHDSVSKELKKAMYTNFSMLI